MQGLTIFVNKNDNKGNIEKIYIFEKNRTIIAKKGRVINVNEKNYLELTDGVIHEKNSKDNIEVINFEKTLFNFTKYKTQITKYTKNQEQKTTWLFKEYLKLNKKIMIIMLEKKKF